MFQATAATQEVARAVLRERPSIGGLCRDCVNEPTCTFPRDPSRPIWSCDEFEASEVAATLPGRPIAAAPEVMVVEEKVADALELKGLCTQCAHRLTCRYPKPPGGVWHCDELA